MADTNITETNVDYEPSVDIQDVNDEIWFDIINRTITPKEGQDLKDVLVQNDANSRNFGFMIQRYFEDDDLSTKNIRVHYVNSLNQHDISAVHSINIVGTNSDVLSFMWLVGNKVCIETGNVQFAIEFYDDDGYELYTKPTMVKIEQGIYTVGEIPEPDDWYKLFKQELLDIQNNIDAKNITTKINLWELQSGVYTVSPNIDLCYAEATDSDSERCYHTRTASVLYVSEYTNSLQGKPINYKSFSILTKDFVNGEINSGTPEHIVFITGTFREESHTSSLSKYYFKETYNLRNWLQLGDGLRSVSPDLIGYILQENEITDNSIKIALDDDYVKNLIQTYTDSEMSDTSENPVQNKVAKAYTDEKTKAIPTDISLNGNLLQLTANGKAVGNGVAIPAPKETFVKTYFDYAKLKDVLVRNLNVFSISHNLNETKKTDVYIRFELIKDKLDESTGVLVVQPVLTGLPSVIYGSTYSERNFDSNEKIGITLRFEEAGEIYDFSEEDFKELFSNENTKFTIGFDNASVSYTIIVFEFSANYNDIDTANAIKSSIKYEILPMFRGLQVAVDRVEWTEKESELVYVE